tara:strand:- start:157 stop:1008 length:852 start_codon:yes stop_codon:yes gene_type:complete
MRFTKKQYPGFTLIELLVVISILSILIGLVSVIANSVLKSAKTATESSALRAMLQAYNLYAFEHNGKVMPGYWPVDEVVRGANGEVLTGVKAKRYVWRLYPYLDDAMSTLYVNDQQPILSQVVGSECYPYVASLYPSFGLNCEWLGGDDRITARIETKFLSDIKHPSRQLVFASARVPQSHSGEDHSDCIDGGISMKMEGWYEIKSPYYPTTDWRWNVANGEHAHAPTANSADHGYLSARHEGKVIAGQIDGSVNYLTIKELADMRRWAPRATSADWIPVSNP